MTRSAVHRATALLQETVHREWRAWSRTLQARLTLLDARLAERDQAGFERDDILAPEAQEAQAILQSLRPDQRRFFAQMVDERRQALASLPQAIEHPDPDTPAILPAAERHEREALTALLREALGDADSHGWGVVPVQTGETHAWYEVHVPTLRAAPDDETYALAEPDGMGLRTRTLLAGLLAVAGILFVLIWFFWPRTAGDALTATHLPAMANGLALTPWPLVGVVVERPNADPLTLSVQQVTTTTPSPGPEQQHAFWNPMHLVPLRLCLPADVLGEATLVTLQSGDDAPDRVYHLLASGAGTPTSGQAPPVDLILEPCHGNAAPRPALLKHTVVPPDIVAGLAHPATDPAVTLVDYAVIGPGEDRTLPSGQARVRVTVQANLTDWTSAAPTLHLADGQIRMPIEPPQSSGPSTVLHYLVPLPTYPLPARWTLTPPGQRQPVGWRITLAGPPDRATLLHRALIVSDVTAHLTQSHIQIQLTVQSQHERPLLLTLDDMHVTYRRSGERLPVSLLETEDLALPLAPNVPHTITVTTPRRDERTDLLIITLGAARFQLNPGTTNASLREGP
ncbi:hypothetical protein EYB53_013520 [Candidatus Chloroploca sp. M-50]|uniref:Uncharacterized protein n=1 Tax=Candidatus Chloroploca mongolica TaxID=2528176 RepID=A0ABS4DBB7_9CHLR|nr:hypothetical protein [Candidatus Chloroploca mongolica]MBP1466730.1 hypothetical protein [Candidatus Chloroploca mongolica]